MNLPLNQIICGDCLEIMRTMPDESVDVIVTSPPYNLGKQSSKSKIHSFRYDSYSDNLPHEKYVKWQRDILSECLRLIKPTGAIFYNHKPRIQKGLLDDRSSIVNGLPLRQIVIWARDGGHNHEPSFFTPTYEYIFLICKKAYKVRQDACGIGDVWRISQERNSDHLCPFPPEIPRRCIASSLHNQIVLDPFCGSGTTCAVAKSLGCDYIGIDISEKYCQMARERCANVTRFFEPLNAELF
jgi:modification methylase